MCPTPNLCLELVQIRLRNGYYRHRNGMIDDLQEAYVNSSLLVLSKFATTKYSSDFSVYRIAKALSASESKPKTQRKQTKKSLAPRKKSTEKSNLKDVSVVPTENRKQIQGKAANNTGTEMQEELEEPKKIGLSDDEAMWMEKLDSVRRLYATAIACVSETAYVERIFGTAPKQMPKPNLIPTKEVLDSEKEFLDREQRRHTARNKVGLLLAAMARDACTNRSKGQSLDLPKVKVNISGLDVAEISDEDIDIRNGFIFEPADYVDNKALIKTFFGKPGKYDTCARCHVDRRTMLSCRVLRAHSSLDFDWVEVFRDVGGVDGLLHTLRTGETRIVRQIGPAGAQSVDETAKSNKESETKNDDTDTGDTEVSKADEEGDVYGNLNNAQRAVKLSKQALQIAQTVATSPLRLSDAFIKWYFPIDPADGKYTMCVVCGHIGDVMCCEGHDCPVVAHPICVGLAEAPIDDWFCIKCSILNSGKASATNGKCARVTPATTEDPDTKAEGATDAPEANSCASSLQAIYDPVAEGERLSKQYAEVTEELLDVLNELKGKRKPKPKASDEGKGAQIDIDNEKLSEDSNKFHPAEVCSSQNDHETSIVDATGESGVAKDDGKLHAPRRSAKACESDIQQQEKMEEEDRASKQTTNDGRYEIVVGAKITKHFNGQGDFAGTVQNLPTSNHPYYRVLYDDGDEEDLSETEIQDLLVLSTSRMMNGQSATIFPDNCRSRGLIWPDSADESCIYDEHLLENATFARTSLSDARRRGRQRGKSSAMDDIAGSPSATSDSIRVTRLRENGHHDMKEEKLFTSSPTLVMEAQRVDYTSDNQVVLAPGSLPTKRKRGRPRKDEAGTKPQYPHNAIKAPEQSPPRKRGRPRKDESSRKEESSRISGHPPIARKRGRPRKDETR